MSDICVMLLTAHRLDYAINTLENLLRNIRPIERIRVHIASDGDDEDYVDRLMEIPRRSDVLVSVSNSEGRGYGANYNAATHVVHQLVGVKYVLPLEDDWCLRSILDVSALCSALDDPALGAGCIRMGYLGWTQQLRGEMRYSGGQHFLFFEPDSPEPHVFSGHPRLETVEWERTVGLWPEGLNPGETEFTVAHYPAARTGVVWPMDVVKPYGDVFTHEGRNRSY